MPRIVLMVAMMMSGLQAYSSEYSLAIDPSHLINAISTKYELLEPADDKPELDLFTKGIIGFINLKESGRTKSNLLTLVDFRLSSNKKRLWVIDLDKNEIIYHSLVAHGRNSGNEYAKVFSNKPNSNKSSLGFYITGENYTGKHGLSLRLDGAEPGYNDHARNRAIVMHGASYVDKSFSKAYGRIGRSFGCPAIPLKGHKEIMRKLANKSVLFIYYPDKDYLKHSVLLDELTAVNYLEEQNFQL